MLRALIAATSLLLAGCTTFGQDRHFDQNPDAVAAYKPLVGHPERASVFLFSERNALHAVSLFPIPPTYYAVDGKMVAVLPVGSYMFLSLAPGQHTFSRLVVTGDWILPLPVQQKDLSLNLNKGQICYVGTSLGPGFSAVTLERGRPIIESAQLAKVVHNPLTVAAFRQKAELRDASPQQAPARAPKEETSATKQASAQTLAGALPTAAQATQFLEVVATVALVAAALFGAAMAPSSTTGATPLDLSPPPGIRTPAQVASSARFTGSSGTLAEILASGQSATIRDISAQVTYRVEGGRVSGTDGSRYQVIGSTLFSDSGITYRVTGNTVFASDGRVCIRTGNTIQC